MFVVSVKTGKKKLLMILAALLLVITLVLAAGKLQGSVGGGGAAAVPGSTNAQRVTFLQSFGWECGTEPLEFKDVTIPAEFDEVYSGYNKLQISQGMDLLPHAGKSCRQWVYAVTNYPGYEAVRATVLVLDEKIIGGDLSDPALDGFMCGFKGQTGTDDYCIPEETAEGAQAAADADANVEAGAGITDNSAPAQAPAIPQDAWPTD